MTKYEPLAVSIADAVQISGIGRSSLYEAAKRGDLPIRKAGRRTLVLTQDIRSWLDALPKVGGEVVE
jgi:predicted DNA-binding transcriptional regulator AlpA